MVIHKNVSTGCPEKPHPRATWKKSDVLNPVAVTVEPFADQHRHKKIDALGDPFAEIDSYTDFVALAG